MTPAHPATDGSSSSIAARSGSTPWFWWLGLGSWSALRPVPPRELPEFVEQTPTERLRYDEAVNRVIQDVEAKYGLRPPRAAESAKPADPAPVIDAETVKEIDSIYAQKRLRDEARAKRRSAAAKSTAAPPPHSFRDHPGTSAAGKLWRTEGQLT